jgi:hypothetical protein
MKVYCTKYALTSGITTHELVGQKEGSATVKWKGGLNGENYLHAGEWHYKEDDAIARAEEMRIAKLKSLDKQMKKLGAMKFSAKEAPNA